jgi:hypothetical protein
MKILAESLDYLDMENKIWPILSIDEYAAKMGEDKDIITLTFIVKSKLVGEDLVTWFERGYDFVLDASVSDGELEPNKYLVFVEMDRRSWAPKNICRLVSDLKTLTGLDPKEWTINIDTDEYPCEEEILKQKLVLNPAKYKMEKEIDTDVELNEFRTKAGLETKPVFTEEEKDPLIKQLQHQAGI